MLNVQAFLRSGGTLESLKEKYAINYRINEDLNVVCLNYNQINSDMNEEIVKECRQLILELDTWDVKSISFKKFHNVAEQKSPEFDWSDFKTYEKLDGSIVTFWHHKDYGWEISTRSVPDANTNMDDTDMTFQDLVILTLKDMGLTFDQVTAFMEPGYSYVCELTAPENQVVVHHEERKLTLLAVRSIHEPFFKECDLEIWEGYNPDFPLPIVTRYDGFSKDAILAEVQERNPIEHEGYVLVDKSYNRVKVKSDAYCLMSYQRDGLGKSNRARLELIFSDKVDDVIGLLPKFVQGKILSLQTALNTLVSSINQTYAEIKHIESQKDFAAEALKYKYSAVLFQMKSGRITDPLDWFKTASVKSVLGWLQLEEEEGVE